MAKQNLIEITGRYKELVDLANDPTSELTEADIADTLQGIEGEFEEKALAVARVINGVGQTASVIDEEIKRLTERKRIVKNREKSVKEYLTQNMVESGIKKIDCELFTVTLSKAAPTVEIDDADALPDEYVDVVTDIKPKKKELAAALKEGPVEGAHLNEGKPYVRIK